MSTPHRRENKVISLGDHLREYCKRLSTKERREIRKHINEHGTNRMYRTIVDDAMAHDVFDRENFDVLYRELRRKSVEYIHREEGSDLNDCKFSIVADTYKDPPFHLIPLFFMFPDIPRITLYMTYQPRRTGMTKFIFGE